MKKKVEIEFCILYSKFNTGFEQPCQELISPGKSVWGYSVRNSVDLMNYSVVTTFLPEVKVLVVLLQRSFP
jgi:hypothetical protein